MARKRPGWGAGLVLCALATGGCAPPRTDFARYPGAPTARDPRQSDPRALAIADRVLTAAGGAAAWNRAHELRWTTTSDASEPPPAPPPEIYNHGLQRTVEVVTPVSGAAKQLHLWDRWDGRYAVRAREGDRDNAAVFDVYGDELRAMTQADRSAVVPLTIFGNDVAGRRAAWHVDTVLVALPFLLDEPGAKLDYIGPIQFGKDDFEAIRVAFSPLDPTRSSVLTVIVDKASMIWRVAIVIPAVNENVVYELGDWTTVAGLAIPTTRTRVDNRETSRVSDIVVREVVHDDDFVWPSDEH